MHIFLRCPQNDHLSQLTDLYSSKTVTHFDVGSTREWDRSIPIKTADVKAIKKNRDLRLKQRRKIGTGEQDYRTAVDALSRGDCFDLGWVKPFVQRPLEEEDTFCLIVRAFGLCSVNFCRVIYAGEEPTADNLFFTIGIGTLEKHAAIGEERLSLNWNRTTDEVHFLIDSYSQPSSWLSKLFGFYLRLQQLKFVDQAPKRMKRAIENRID